MRERGRLGKAIGVHREDIGIRQTEPDRAIPSAMEFVFPVTATAVVLDDEADFRSRFTLRIGRWPGVSARTDRSVRKRARLKRLESRTDSALRNSFSLVA